MIITRNPECMRYLRCLDQAARHNRKDFTCEGCDGTPSEKPNAKAVKHITPVEPLEDGSAMTEEQPSYTPPQPKMEPVPDPEKLCTSCGLKPAIVARRTGKPVHGLCRDCWYTKFKDGTINAEKRQKPQCKVTGCDAPSKARGFCGPHYDRWRDRGIDGVPPFKTVKPDWRTKAVPQATKPKPIVKKSIFINLNGYDILDDLADAAHTHMRPVEMQALAYIVAGLQGDGYGKEGKTKE